MSYVGNTPISAAFLTDTFSGTGSATAFTMTVAPANTSSIIVAVTGVLQDPSTYSVSGTTLTFSAAPPTGTSNISVRYLGIPASGVTTTAYRTETDTTATAGQTSFTIPSYTVGYVDVFRNGVRLAAADFTATTGTTVVLANSCTVGDTVTTVSFYVSSVLNAIPAIAGSVSDSYIASLSTSKLTGTVADANIATVSASKLTGSRTIPKGTMPTGTVLQVVNVQSGTLATTSVAIPTDNTIPQNTEGAEFFTVAITPTSATSKLLILVNAVMGNTPGQWPTIALFQDSTVNALAAATVFQVTGSAGNTLSIQHFMTSGTTSATTFKMRFGLGSGQALMNGPGGGALFGGTCSTSMTVMEIAA